MIRRLNKHSDLKDLIKSCPSGVIDDIYAIEYYIQGYNTVIQENFTKKETMLEVIIPSTDLETLPNGILMRRAYYKVLDASYPDGYYNLEFEDNMNVWIGENESEEPVIPEYVTEEELAETLEGYVTGDDFNNEVNDIKDHINAVEDSLSGYVTDQVFAAHVAENANQFNNVDANLQSVDDRILATNAHLQSVDDRVTVLEQSPGGVSQEQFAAHVAANNEAFNILQGETQDHSQRIDALENAGFATQQDLDDAQSVLGNDIQAVQDSVDGIDQRVTDLEQGGTGGGSWGSITGDIGDQQDLMYEFDKDRGRLNDLEDGTLVPTGTATETWVQNQGYITSSDLSGYATESWVQGQGYITSSDLSGYATESWVQQQGYLTSVPSTYATKTWATNQFLEENKVWTGTFTQWVQLTAEQQASYTIALIIE